MIAEIYGKLSDTRIERSEDELTGNFFGNLRYLSFNRGLKQILKSSIFPAELAKEFDCIDAEDWAADNIEFWPREKEAEPDILLDFEGIAILIEVKYRSGLSSDDDADSSVDDERIKQESTNQLAREAKLLKRIASGKKKILILLAPEISAHQVYADVKNRNLFNDVFFGYITWQKAFDALKTIDVSSPFEESIIDDLISLLRRKGFEGFRNFDMSFEPVDTTAIWTFDYTASYCFSFVIEKDIERGLFYEFR